MLGGIQHCCCTYAEEVEPDNHWAAAYQMVEQILQKNYHDLGKAGSIANQVCFIHTLDWIMDWTYYRLGHMQRCRKDFLIGGAQSETTHRVVSNLYNNL